MTILNAKEGFTFGADPEAFIFDDRDRPVPAYGIIPGDKLHPYPVDKGAVQVDGMAAEFNIDPASTFAEFNRNIETVWKTMEKMLPAGYTLRAVPSVRFEPEVFAAAADHSKELGCNPDYDAWTGAVNPPPSDPSDPYMRCAAGHLHIGWTDKADLKDLQHLLNCRHLVQQLDWYLGAWSVRMDTDPTRRQLYGKAGAYRPKVYGAEYRVLSNFWISSRDRRLTVWNRMQMAITDMQKGFMPDYLPEHYHERLRESINTTTRDFGLESEMSYPIKSVTNRY